ncbi:uncharacterized protein [Linepithema humile]|uniref:uncharacterized protein isoform X2 n=1 Tax=Linepithema humile TaxID=83485 RepID=UPI00351DAC79
MNFESANKISQEYVRKLLLNHIPDSEGTVLYLKLLNYIILSYTDLYLTPLERLSKLWYCVFIIRIWRNWIKGNRKYTLTDNFLSLNCYACIEINAHSMINMIQKLRDCNMSHLFMPPLFSSQPCEAFFRQIRSMSTTYSTIVNCSLLDVIHRIKKIQLQTDILASKLNKNISFPRIEYKVKTIQIQPNLPTNDDIYEAIEKARKKAITDAHKFDLEPGELNCNLPLIVDARVDDSKADFFDGENRDENDILYDYVDGTRENSTITSASIRASTSRSMEQEDDEFPAEDILEDVSTLSCMSDGYLNMKNYGETTLALSKTSPFTIVADARGKEMVVRKSSICWLLNKNCGRLSSDRLQRVMEKEFSSKPKSTLRSNLLTPSCRTCDDVTVGKSEKSREFSKECAIINYESNREVGVLCSWYSYDTEGNVKPILIESHGYISLRNYVCTITNGFIENKLKLHETVLKYIKSFVETEPIANPNDYVLVPFETNKSFIYYIGVVIFSKENEYNIKFMKKKENYLFYFPKRDDICVVKSVNIVRKLSSPNIDAKGLYSFSPQELATYKLG